MCRLTDRGDMLMWTDGEVWTRVREKKLEDYREGSSVLSVLDHVGHGYQNHGTAEERAKRERRLKFYKDCIGSPHDMETHCGGQKEKHRQKPHIRWQKQPELSPTDDEEDGEEAHSEKTKPVANLLSQRIREAARQLESR